MPRRHAREVEQLAALLDGSRAPAEVGREARRLGALATAVAERDALPAVTLTEDRRAAMRDRLLADIAELDRAPEAARTPVLAPVRERLAGAARSARVGLATGLAAAMVGTTGVAFAAQEALPGDALYRIKQITESTRLSLAGDVAQQGRLQLRFAEERLEEVATGYDRIGSARLVTALQEMDERSLAGAEALLAEAERTGDGQLILEVDAFTERQAVRIIEIYGELPADVRPHVEDSLGVLRRIRLELLFPALQACDCVELAGAVVAPLSDGASLGERLRSAALPVPTPSLELSTLADGLSELEAAAVERVERAVERVTPQPDGAGGQEKTSDAGGGTVGRVTDGVGDAVEDTTGRVGSTVGRTTGEVGGVVDDVTGGTVGGNVGSVGEDVGGVVEDVGSSVGDVVRDPGKVVRDPAGTVGGVVDDVADGVGDAADSVGDTVGGVTGGLRDGLGGLGGG
ncbi:DUF5667 domain-containing protein [Egicoccus sp. AB-alg2]|uniref:DUF5667 domain-containing protein n=1 Tax=Egicoccus sp. AB-alg2 TaxID=3242693 RepID=UPI00359CD91F